MFIRYFHDQMVGEHRPENNFKILKYNLPYMFYLFLPKVLAIIFIPIIKQRTEDEGDASEVSRLSRNYHFIAESQSKKKTFLMIYFISLLEVIQETGDLLLYYYQRTGVINWLIEKKIGLIIFVPIFCYFIMKTSFHRHHILSLFLGLVGAFIINIIRFILKFSYVKYYLWHLLNFFFSFILSLAFVLIKYVMLKYLIISPYLFLFYDGIFCILNSLICILLEYVLVINISEFEDKEQLMGENKNYFINNYLGIFTIFKGQSGKF